MRFSGQFEGAFLVPVGIKMSPKVDTETVPKFDVENVADMDPPPFRTERSEPMLLRTGGSETHRFQNGGF